MRYNPQVAEFWDAAALEKEMYRQIDVCHGCRLCFNLCPVFPEMFDRIDARGDTVENLNAQDFHALSDLCYQCKLCFEKCPYTPPHSFEIDIPRLFQREQAIRARQRGWRFGERFISDTDLLGRIGSALTPLTNRLNQNRIWRALVMEPLLGIHRDRRLPEYHRETFLRWFKRRRPAPIEEPVGKVALFASCMVNYNSPQIGKAAVQVLAHNEVEVVCPPQICCGMPFIGSGVDRAAEHARRNIASFRPWLEQGYEIVTPEPACAWVLTREYPALLETEEARQFAARVKDLSQYLLGLNRARKLKKDFREALGKVAYHFSCNSRALEIGYGSRDLLALVPNTEVESIERCSGMDGTWGMKKEHFEQSLQIGRKLFRRIEEANAAHCAGDCSMACRQIEQAMDRPRPVHPIELLHRAYGLRPAEPAPPVRPAPEAIAGGIAVLAVVGLAAGLTTALLWRRSHR